MDKIEKLKNLLLLMQNDTVTPALLKQFIEFILSFIKKEKDSLIQISNENLKDLKEDLRSSNKTSIDELNKIIKEKLDKDTEEAKIIFSKDIKEAKDLISSIKKIKSIPGKNGSPGHNPDPSEVVPLVIAKLPKTKPFSLEGTKIVDRINELEIEPDKQIDFSHIKNVPEMHTGKAGGVFGSTVKEAPRDGKYYARYNRSWIEIDPSDGTWGSITGILSNQTDLQTALNLKASKSFAIAMAVAL